MRKRLTNVAILRVFTAIGNSSQGMFGY